MLSFIQRTSIAVAGESIIADLHISKFQIGLLNATFLTVYTLMQIPAGALGERLGARRTYLAVGILGLTATLALPLVPAVFAGSGVFAALLITQAILGVSQAPVFPMCAAVIEAWFPVNQWGVANGVQTSGMLIGGAVTPLIIVGLKHSIGWRGALLSIALPVLVIFAAWYRYGRDRPEEHPCVTCEELNELTPRGAPAIPITLRRLALILGDRSVLALSMSYFCMNYAFYLLTFWSFFYLVEVRHFAGVSSGIAGMLPWLGAAAGAAIGGRLSDRAVDRWGPLWGYRIVPLVSLPIAASLLLAAVAVPTPWTAVLAMSAAFASIEVNEGAYWSATMRVARAETAPATAVLNTGGNAGGIVCQPVVAFLSSSGGWEAAFGTGALMALIASALWLFAESEPSYARAVVSEEPG